MSPILIRLNDETFNQSSVLTVAMRINVTVAIDVDLDKFESGPVHYNQIGIRNEIAHAVEQVARPAIIAKGYGNVARVRAKRVYGDYS